MSAPNLSYEHEASRLNPPGVGGSPSPRPPLMPATVTAGLASVTECLVCEKPIRTMAFRFTGVCSGNCQKRLADSNLRAEMGLPSAVVLP